MYGDNKQIRAVADIAAQIMAGTHQPVQEELKGDQHKIDKNKNGKIDAQDFKILKGQKANEEVELEEGWDDMVKAAKDSVKSGPKPSGGSGVKQGTRYGGGRQKDEPEADDKPKKKKMSEMVAAYKDGGFKALEEAWGKKKKVMKEEPDSEQFAKELEDQKAKFDGKKKGGDVAKPSVQAVKNEEVELEEGTMTGITLGAKVKNKQGGYNQDVHHKGKKIGHIEAYKDRGGMRYGGHHHASGDMTAGNRDVEDSIADIRYSHAEHLKSMKKEEVEQIDELKKSTLGSYVKKASKNLSDRSFDHGEDEHRQYGYGDDHEEDKRVDSDEKKIATRQQGINRAATKLAKEEVEQIEERHLTAAETEKKESTVKSMKKNLAGFKERYGDRAKSVMYATATKQAKGE